MKIVCLKNYLLEPLKKTFPNLEIIDEINREAEILICEPKECIQTNLERMPLLKCILLSRVGYDSSDIDYIKNRNIVLCNAKGLYDEPINEHIMNNILMYTNRTLDYLDQKNKKLYQSLSNRILLNTLTIGFLGCGSIARMTVKKLIPYNCNIIGYKRTQIELEGFSKIYTGNQLSVFLNISDIVICCVDLNKETYHILNDKTLHMMKKDSAIINIARGPVIDENALISIIKEGYIAYAGLDVFENEPLSINSELWNLKQVYITPHAAGQCKENHQHLFELVKSNIQNYLNNEPFINIIF